jgi:hypothetical protein
MSEKIVADILSPFSLIVIASTLLLFTECRGANTHTPVIITQKAPIEILSVSSEMVSVTESSVGAKYTFVWADTFQVTLQDDHGTHYRIAIGATNYTPAAVAQPLTSSKPGKTALPASDNSGEQVAEIRLSLIGINPLLVLPVIEYFRVIGQKKRDLLYASHF